MRSLIVHNNASGFGSDAVFEFERALLEQGDECVMRVLPGSGGGHECLADAEDFDLVVLSGGDGTVSGLLWELRGRDVLSCVFPSGTANLLHANLGSAAEPAAIARACRRGLWARTDLGELSWEDPSGAHVCGFGVMSGTGYDARLMQAAVPNKQSMGEAAYFAAALKNIRPQVSHFSIEVDGRRYERDGISCIVANCAMIQGEVEIVPDSSMDDGRLDVIMLETEDAVHLLRPMFASLVDPAGNRLGRPYLEHLSGERVRVRTSRPQPMQIDGEVVAEGVTEYEAQALPCCKLVVDGLSRYRPQGERAPVRPWRESRTTA